MTKIQQKTELFIRFTDNCFYCVYYHPFYREEQIISSIPLYISFHENSILFFENAFKTNDCICLMQSESILNELLSKKRSEVMYIIPSVQQVWNIMMKQILSLLSIKINSNEKYHLTIDNIILCLSDFIDVSLKQLIINALEVQTQKCDDFIFHYIDTFSPNKEMKERNYTNEFEDLHWQIIYDSLLVRNTALNTKSISVGNVLNQHLYTFIQCGFHTIECYIVYYPSPNKAILLNKKQLSSTFGSSSLYKIISKELYNSDFIEYQYLATMMKESRNSSSKIPFTNEKSINTYYIESEFIKKQLSNDIQKFKNSLFEFQQESIQLLQNELKITVTQKMKEEINNIYLSMDYHFLYLQKSLEECNVSSELKYQDFLSGGRLLLDINKMIKTSQEKPQRLFEMELSQVIRKNRFKILFTEVHYEESNDLKQLTNQQKNTKIIEFFFPSQTCIYHEIPLDHLPCEKQKNYHCQFIDTDNNEIIYQCILPIFENTQLDQWNVRLDNYLNIRKPIHNQLIDSSDYLYQIKETIKPHVNVTMTSIINKIPLERMKLLEQSHKMLAFYYCLYSYFNTTSQTVEKMKLDINSSKRNLAYHFNSEQHFLLTNNLYLALFSLDPYSFNNQWDELKKKFNANSKK